jgi:hypothetical protein
VQTIPTIGFDIAKSVFLVHGVDTQGSTRFWRPRRDLFILELPRT